jgi:hypothetical protein
MNADIKSAANAIGPKSVGSSFNTFYQFANNNLGIGKVNVKTGAVVFKNVVRHVMTVVPKIIQK